MWRCVNDSAQQNDSFPLDKAGRGQASLANLQSSYGIYLSSRNYDSNIHSEQPLNVERDFFFFRFHFIGMNVELSVNNFFYDYSNPGREAELPFLG